MDFTRIRDGIRKEIGDEQYYASIMQIAETIEIVEREFRQSSRDDVEDIENFIIQSVVERISGKRRYLKKKDMLESKTIDSLDAIVSKTDNEDIDIGNFIEHENIEDFDNLGQQVTRDHRRGITDKLDVLTWIEDMLKENPRLKLTELKVGRQTANDWLSDLTGKMKDGDTKLIIKRITKLRKLSKKNYRSHTKTQKLRELITKVELKNMTTEEICIKHKLDYNGSTRKIISRIRAAH